MNTKLNIANKINHKIDSSNSECNIKTINGEVINPCNQYLRNFISNTLVSRIESDKGRFLNSSVLSHTSFLS